MAKDVIIACDFDSAAKTYAFLDRFTGRKPFVKIGMELFYAEGPEIVRQIKARGHQIFLDLKLHDIPNTVKKAMTVLRNLDVDICNLHASGTIPMMEAALEGLTRPDGTRPLLIAVTQLTSTDQQHMEDDLLIREPIDQVVLHYAQNARKAGNRPCRLRSGFSDRHPRRALCRWRRRRSEARHHPGPRPGAGQRLHRGGPSHHGGCRSGGSV